MDHTTKNNAQPFPMRSISYFSTSDNTFIQGVTLEAKPCAPASFLIGHAMESVLKHCLAIKGKNLKKIQGYSHDLRQLLRDEKLHPCRCNLTRKADAMLWSCGLKEDNACKEKILSAKSKILDCRCLFYNNFFQRFHLYFSESDNVTKYIAKVDQNRDEKAPDLRYLWDIFQPPADKSIRRVGNLK